MDFKTFESELYRESGGMLRKSPLARRWEKIAVGKSQIEGTGVWAMEPLVDNEVAEECQVIVLTREDVLNTPLIDYVFKVSDDSYVLALGNGSLYQHRNQPNLRWNYDESRKVLVFRASRPVKAGEELFVSYGRDFFKSRGVSMKGEINLTNTSGVK
jgi:SET domain-containing protein